MRLLTIDEEIKHKLSWLQTELEYNAADGMYSVHKMAENIFKEIFNIIHKNASFYNVNTKAPNIKGIDIRSDNIHCIIQITSENSKNKIISTLKCCDIESNKGYKLIILIITKKKVKIKGKIDNCLYINFNCDEDVWDLKKLIRVIGDVPVIKKEKIRDFLNRAIGASPVREENESALERVIQLLSEEDKEYENIEEPTLPFDISQKINYNDLQMRYSLISDLCGGLAVVSRVYDRYEQEGENKRKSVINAIRREYNLLADEYKGIELYDLLVKNIESRISFSTGLFNIKKEDVTRYCDMLVVDTFLKCKVFKKPI